MLVRKTYGQFLRQFSNFIPKHESVSQEDKNQFIFFLRQFNKILVLTGAGVSTESGIPDYRSEDVGMFARTSYKPIQYSDFVKNPNARQRYWLRNFIAWPRFSSFLPNATHHSIKKFEVYQKVTSVVTQNVDGLHSKAGSNNVVELHGNAYWVKCLGCDEYISRHDFQDTLRDLNPHCNVTSDAIRPDGDVEVNEEDIQDFKVPDCQKCGGILKPAIVFFGENIPQKRVEKVEALVEDCDALLILGTSLSTLSSYRICTQAYNSCKFIFIINIGETRGDKMADLKINAKCSEVFPKIDIPLNYKD